MAREQESGSLSFFCETCGVAVHVDGDGRCVVCGRSLCVTVKIDFLRGKIAVAEARARSAALRWAAWVAQDELARALPTAVTLRNRLAERILAGPRRRRAKRGA